MRRHDSNQRRRAFSIVELLVTIRIIAALISVLLPALAKARRVSRSTSCKARLEQLGSAFQMYLNENHTHYPRAPSLPSVNPNNYPTIPRCLGRYVSDAGEAFRCPADENVFPVETVRFKSSLADFITRQPPHTQAHISQFMLDISKEQRAMGAKPW